jgi:plastocyanin
MRGVSGRKAILGLAVIGAAALGAPHALGAAETITSSPACCTFSKGTFTTGQGEVASFQNVNSGTSHNVTASGNGPDGQSLFRSATITSGQAPVDGTQYLAAGTYHFICTIHGSSMSADLVVTGSGTPLARPDIAVKVLSRKLDRVVSRGKLKVKVTASTESSDVALTARKGARKLGSKHKIDLAAGTSRKLKLPLTLAAKNALEGLGSAKVKVTGTVPFGSPATAKRKLR